jgi:hypothetical protein
VLFNDYTKSPVYRVISRAPQQRNVRELDIPIPFENGISDFETLIGKTVYVLDGIMYPGGESEYDAGLRALRRLASLELQQDDPLSDEGYVPYEWEEFNSTKQVFLKVLYVQLPESTRKGLVQPFRLICKIKDPTIFGTTVKIASTQSVDPSTSSGAAVYPFSYPIVFGASTYSVTSAATNEGDLPVYPLSITVYGPVNQPVITNDTTGESIKVAENLGSSSNVLRISYDKDSLSAEIDGVNVLGSTSGDFFKLQPGANEITLTGSSIGSGAYVEVSYRDGWPL